MRGFLLAVALLAAATAIASAIDEECVQRKVRGLPVHWPNPTDCSSFYRCTNKNIKRELLCPEGKEYNPRTGRCGSKGQNLCRLSLIAPLAELTNPCTDELSGTFVADDKSCRGFNICNNNVAYPQTCDAGSYFNAEIAACEPDTQTLCWENLCVKKENGLYVADANDCHSFYICNDEKAVAQTCPVGSYFNAESLNCQPGKCPSEEPVTTCAPETTTTPCAEVITTTTCVPETTTTCAAETMTTTCAAETITLSQATTTCAAETTTCAADAITTTCSAQEITTPANTDDGCSNLNCDSNKCQNALEGFTFPAQNTTTGFCVCLEQKAVYRKCSDDAVYSESLQICVAQEKVCPSSKCAQLGDYATFPASNTTAGFCRCLEGVASYFQCVETGYVYSETLGFCVKSPNSDDCEEETSKLCEGGYKEGDFVPNADNCMLFYICYDGELLESSCETGNYYDDEIKACMPDTEGNCPDCQVAQAASSNKRNKRSVRASTCVEGVKSQAVDCDKYYKCSGGQKLLYGCGKGNFFNPITLTCEFDSNHVCLKINTCINGEKTPTSNDRDKYYECVDGKQVLKTCVPDSFFDKLSMSCVAEEVCTCPGGYKEGEISAHPKDCDKFYICIAGEQVIHECGKGNFFNKNTLGCEKDVKNTCKVEAPCMCPGGYEEGDLSAHPQDCDKFYICVDGKQVLQECGKDNYFDNSTLTCEPDIYNECWSNVACTCPGGYEEGEFSAHPTDCNKYYICHGGHQVLEECGINNYFNNDTLMCEPDVYHVCWPNLCAGKPNGDLVANPQQCNAFFLCENEEAIPNSCLEGQYFDTRTSACEADLKAICYNPCETESAGPVVLLPHPICNKYFFCNDRKIYVGTCLVGSFDIATGVCDETKKCLPNPCEDPLTITFADPFDPTKFYYCNADRQPIPMDCPAGAEYDKDAETCLKVSDPDCPVCTKDGSFPTLDVGNDAEFCVCIDGLGTKIECPSGYTFNAELGTCYSNAACDPSFCLESKEYAVSQNRNDTKSFCMCINKKPIIVECPNNGNFNPYTSSCSEHTISPECKQSECVEVANNGKVFNPINTKTSNGICVCKDQIAIFRPCNIGSTLNPTLIICQLAEINCNSYQCKGLANNAKIPALTTTGGYCECVAGVASFHNCPDNGEFSAATNKCETPICDLTKCKNSWNNLPASNTIDGFCMCHNNIGFQPCSEGKKYSIQYENCIAPCFPGSCTGKADSYSVSSLLNDNSFCVCHADGTAPTFEVCEQESFKFSEADQRCVANAKELCGAKVCTGFEMFEAINTITGFCMCLEANSQPIFSECPNGIYDANAKTCIQTAKDVCDVSLCASATIKQPLTLPSTSSDLEFCYCSSPTDVMLLPCPYGKHYNPTKGMCVSSLEEGLVLCDDGIEAGQKVPERGTCNKYSVCADGVMVPMTCPAGEYFNNKLKECAIDDECICEKMAQTTCLGVYYENEHLSHPINPHMYYVCKNGMLHEHKCPAHRIFSASQKQCIVSTKHQAKKRSADFSPDHEFGCLKNEKRSVPSNCSQYEICLEQTWQRKTCSNYRYYNPEQKMCLEPRDDFVCSYAKVTALPTCTASRELQLHQAKTCQQYYRCEQGKWRLKACGRQQYFNVKLSTCLPVPQDPEFQCWKLENLNTLQHVVETPSGPVPTAPACQHLSQRFYGKNCAMYLICLDNDWWHQYCPSGMFYNQTLNYCVPDSQQQCKDVLKTQVTPAAEEFSKDSCQQDGLLRPSALACNRYFVCLNGKWQMQHCGLGEFYDIANAKCSPDNEGVCSQLNVDCWPNERRVLPRNCSAYEQCSNDGKWLKLNCPEGEIFDELLQQCSANQGICSKHGLRRTCRQAEIMAVPQNCSAFYYCSLEEWNLGNCLKGFMYSSQKGMCIAHTAEDACKPLQLNQTQASALQQGSELCQGKPDGTSVAHPNDCSRYYICIQQSASHEMQCSKGSYFEANLGYCRPNDGTCRLPLTGVCANAKDESLVAHPSDCQAYYKCSTINGTELLHCPEGQYYHNFTHQCRLDRGECKKDATPKHKCTGFAHGTRLAHETFCNIYYVCVKGLPIPVECPDNYQFNAILGKCVADEKHQCQNGQLVDGNFTYSCGNLSDGTYLPDRKDCTRYYICSQGQALPKKCASSSYFDSELLLCVPDDGSCPFVNQNNPVVPDPLMCEGKHGYLMTDPFNCNNFYACIHNKLKHERCYDQQFFNTTTQQCQQKPLAETNANGNTTAVPLMVAATTKSQNTQCLDETTSIVKLCSEMSKGTSLAEPGDCRRYITCQQAEEEPVSQRCRNGESFDSLLGFCRQNDGTCLLENGQRVGECSGKHGQLARDTNSCRNYFVCINGQKIAQSCQPNEYFSKTLNMCLKDTQQVCTTTQSPEEQSKQSCAGLSESVLYPYIYDSCRSYFQCIKGVAKIHKCADDLYFDPLAIKCVKNKTECIMPTATLQRSPAFSQTFSKLCSNKKLEIPHANLDNDCRSFYICHANGDVSHELCPLGMMFNRELMKCTAENKTTCDTNNH